MCNKIQPFSEITCDLDGSGGLCNYCPLEDGQKGTHLYPTGHYSCEGSHCMDAYISYVNNKLPIGTTLCDACRHRGYETMSDVAACNCCNGYEYYSPDDDTDDAEEDDWNE